MVTASAVEPRCLITFACSTKQAECKALLLCHVIGHFRFEHQAESHGSAPVFCLSAQSGLKATAMWGQAAKQDKREKAW